MCVCVYCKSCEMLQLTIKYQFEHTNHDTNPNILFLKSLRILGS